MIKPKLSQISQAAFNISHLYTNATSTAAAPLASALTTYNPLNVTVGSAGLAFTVYEGASVEVMILIFCAAGTMSTALAISSAVFVPSGTQHNDALLANSTNSTANSVTSNTNSLSCYFYYTDSTHSHSTYTLTESGTLSGGSVDIFVMTLPSTLTAMDPKMKQAFAKACVRKIRPELLPIKASQVPNTTYESFGDASSDCSLIDDCCSKCPRGSIFCPVCGTRL